MTYLQFLFNRHAGLVCLCGRAINDELCSQILGRESRTLSIEEWQTFAVTYVHERVAAYATFNRLVKTLINTKHRDALQFLRQYIIGIFNDYVSISNLNDQKLAAFLTAEGALQANPLNQQTEFKMSSPLVDSLIRRLVIPQAFPNAPRITVPLLSDNSSLDILAILMEALKFFDKNVVQLGFERSYKYSNDQRVNGLSFQQVPRESVYDQELHRILMNWLTQNNQYIVIGQWHTEDYTIEFGQKGRHKFLDIVIDKNGRKVVLEILATGQKKYIIDHVKKTPLYKKRISAAGRLGDPFHL